MTHPRPPLGAALAALAALAGCAAPPPAPAAVDARADRRVALLPFADRHDGDHASAVPLALLADHLPLLADPAVDASRGAVVLRAKVHAELARRTAFELVPLPAVDAGLAAAGVDPAALAALADGRARAAAARRLGEAVGADVVAFGEVTAWGRAFYGVEAHATVGLRLELRDAATGARLHLGEAEELAHSGLSQVPLPLATDPLEVPAWILVELVRGLSTSAFHRLSDDVAAAALDGLAPPADAQGAVAPPAIDLVAHSADGPLAAGDPLVVVARGEPGARGAFRVGAGPWTPLVESAPGTYRGSVVASAARPWRGAGVVVRLTGAAGRAATLAHPGPGVTLREDLE